LWIEPNTSTHTQDFAWSAGFVVFALLCGVAALMNRSAVDAMTEWPPAKETLPWLLLSAAGSMLLVSTTSQLTQNVASVPFLWILPLSAYLLSFIICFESPRWYHRGFFLRMLAVALASLAYVLYDVEVSVPIVVAIPLFTLGLFIACMFCHGELSRRRPAASRLTAYYLMIALGGAIGAILTGLVAPRAFSGIHEFPLSLVLVALLALWMNWREGITPRLLWLTMSVAMTAALIAEVHSYEKNAVIMMRSFYGSLRVAESVRGGGPTRTLYHGIVQHGAQFLDPAKRDDPTMYYGPQSGVGLALRFCCDGPKRVAVIGLGAGTLAAYGNPGDAFQFYEINPQVIGLAKSQFTFLGDSKAAIAMTAGDARLSLERETSAPYDVLVADAFSGDAIPVHLLTKEAFALYFQHLKPSGILAIHISNNYLNLAPVVAQLAASSGSIARLVHTPKDDAHLYSQADWVLVTRKKRPEMADVGTVIAPREGLRLWTDDYNNLLQVLRF
jgi:hypothetical protein